MTRLRRCAHDLPFRAQECWCTAGLRWTNSATSATATRPTWARASRCPSTTAPTISTSSRFPLHLPRNCLKVLFERFPSHCELDELCRRVAIAYQPGHWAAQAFDTAIPHLEETSWFMTWVEGYCVFIVKITLKPVRGHRLNCESICDNALYFVVWCFCQERYWISLLWFMGVTFDFADCSRGRPLAISFHPFNYLLL